MSRSRATQHRRHRTPGSCTSSTLTSAPGLAAFHEELRDQPDAYVLAKTILDNGGTILNGGTSTVAQALFHEIAETFIDPTTNLWAQASDGTMYAIEVCDPVQGVLVPIVVSVTTAPAPSPAPSSVRPVPAPTAPAPSHRGAMVGQNMQTPWWASSSHVRGQLATPGDANAPRTASTIVAAPPTKPCGGCAAAKAAASSASFVASANIPKPVAAPAPTTAPVTKAPTPVTTSVVVGLSDFVYPSWFDTEATPGTRFSYANAVTRPFQIAHAGYAVTTTAGAVTNRFGATVPQWVKDWKNKSRRLTSRKVGDVLIPVPNPLTATYAPQSADIVHTTAHAAPNQPAFGKGGTISVNPAVINTVSDNDVPPPSGMRVMPFGRRETLRSQMAAARAFSGTSHLTPKTGEVITTVPSPLDATYTPPTSNVTNTTANPAPNAPAAGRHDTISVNPSSVNTGQPAPAAQTFAAKLSSAASAASAAAAAAASASAAATAALADVRRPRTSQAAYPDRWILPGVPTPVGNPKKGEVISTLIPSLGTQYNPLTANPTGIPTSVRAVAAAAPAAGRGDTMSVTPTAVNSQAYTPPPASALGSRLDNVALTQLSVVGDIETPSN